MSKLEFGWKAECFKIFPAAQNAFKYFGEALVKKLVSENQKNPNQKVKVKKNESENQNIPSCLKYTQVLWRRYIRERKMWIKK